MNDHRPIDDQGAACTRVRGRLEALCDGELTPLEVARDEGHLEACASCAAERARCAALLADLAATLGPPTDASWRDAGLAARLAAARAPRAPFSARVLGPAGDRSGAPILAAAAAVLVLIGLGASGAIDELTADVRSNIEAPTNAQLQELWDGAAPLDSWFGGWLRTAPAEEIR